MLTMMLVGFLEELIFRGFLFTALRKDSLKVAVIVSSVTFGMGHIVNLLNGAPLGETLLQIVYATAAGFLFTAIFLRGGSLWPAGGYKIEFWNNGTKLYETTFTVL
jgi:membrane protease YdiL (CAAX protease family)